MIDAFFCTCARDPLRFGLAMATLHRLKCDTSLNVHVLRTPEAWLEPKDTPYTTVWASDEEFQRERRATAAEAAQGEVYIVSDDDVLPLDGDFAERGKEIMERHPEFAVLCPRAIGVQYLEQEGFKDAEVEESAEAGGLYFIRRGLFQPDKALVGPYWPRAQKLNNYDMLQSDAIRKMGHKVGRFRKLTMNHTGLCFSMATHNQTGYVHA